jgi:phosphonate C-P lyase system protein PhnG
MTSESASVEEFVATVRATLPELDPQEVRRLLDRFANEPLEVVGEPSTGLVMMTLKDAFGESFHAGEVLAARAEVVFLGVRAHATVMGEEPEKAVFAAALDALVRADPEHPLLEELREAFGRTARRVLEARADEARLAAATRVRFESMAPEEME